MPDESAAGAGVAAAPADRVAPRDLREVRDVIRQAAADRSPLRLAGAGTWLHAGAPVAAARVLDLSALRGIVEYVPGDLTLTARAGTTLAELAAATQDHGQWLALDPFGDAHGGGTLGATLATASAGPLAATIGAPRDVALGVTFVAGDGAVVQGGGRVVKNVAGFDLTRLMIGAWGTLGALVEATVRLRARPEADVTVALPLPDEFTALEGLMARVRAAPLEPLAAELVSPALAARLHVAADGGGALLVRLAGNGAAVAHQQAVLRSIAPAHEVDPAAWQELRASDPEGALIVRASRRPTELPRLWSLALSRPGVDAHATLARGIVRFRFATPAQAAVLSGLAPDDRRIPEVIPRDWPDAPAWPAADGHLARRLRLAFDPEAVLNRGIMGTGTP